MSETHRWNVQPVADGKLWLCRGEHDDALGCVWETFVPEATIVTQRALIAELVGALLTLAEPTGLGETPCWCGASWHMPAHAPDCTQASAALKAAKEAE